MKYNPIIFLILLIGCVNTNNSNTEHEAILECVLQSLITHSDVDTSMNIYITDSSKWTDSTSYVSVAIDTENLFTLEGEFWTSNYNGFKIYQFLNSVDTGYSRNIDDFTQTTSNRLKWNKQSKEIVEQQMEITPPYNPPNVDFIYNPSKKCIENYLVNGKFKSTLHSMCKSCNVTS